VRRSITQAPSSGTRGPNICTASVTLCHHAIRPTTGFAMRAQRRRPLLACRDPAKAPRVTQSVRDDGSSGMGNKSPRQQVIPQTAWRDIYESNVRGIDATCCSMKVSRPRAQCRATNVTAVEHSARRALSDSSCKERVTGEIAREAAGSRALPWHASVTSVCERRYGCLTIAEQPG
jgi:hypothetical protein